MFEMFVCFFFKENTTKKHVIPRCCAHLGRTRTSRTGGETRRRPNSVRSSSQLASLSSFPPQIRNISLLSTPPAASMKCFPSEKPGKETRELHILKPELSNRHRHCAPNCQCSTPARELPLRASKRHTWDSQPIAS